MIIVFIEYICPNWRYSTMIVLFIPLSYAPSHVWNIQTYIFFLRYVHLISLHTERGKIRTRTHDHIQARVYTHTWWMSWRCQLLRVNFSFFFSPFCQRDSNLVALFSLLSSFNSSLPFGRGRRHTAAHRHCTHVCVCAMIAGKESTEIKRNQPIKQKK